MPSIRCTIVELCVFRRTGRGPEFLILKRSSSERLYPGAWQIITGTIKRSEKAMVAALRELREETGLSAKRFWVAPLVGSFFDPVNDSVQQCPLFVAEVDSTAEPRLSKEHESFKWAGRKTALEMLVWPGHHDAVRLVQEFFVGRKEAARLTEMKPILAERN
jgi:8-oxo-dGTP pyrophosphatase MutT (NUDIX family)